MSRLTGSDSSTSRYFETSDPGVMEMQPIHPELQRLLADERVEALTRSMTPNDGAGARLVVGRLLVRAGLRLAPELRQRGERGYRPRPLLR